LSEAVSVTPEADFAKEEDTRDGCRKGDSTKKRDECSKEPPNKPSREERQMMVIMRRIEERESKEKVRSARNRHADEGRAPAATTYADTTRTGRVDRSGGSDGGEAAEMTELWIQDSSDDGDTHLSLWHNRDTGGGEESTEQLIEDSVAALQRSDKARAAAEP